MNQTDDLKITAGRWHRFDRYEIREDVIVPADGAVLEQFDPWAATDAERPYESLLRLAQDVRFLPPTAGTPHQLDDASERLVLEWVHEHGVLGVLPHRAMSVRLAPRWATLFSPDPNRLFPRVLTHVKTTIGWNSEERSTLPNSPGTYYLVDEPDQFGELVPDDAIPPQWATAGVLLRRLDGFEIHAESFRPYWARYFPSVPDAERETYAYPLPLSDAFWHLYGEPIGEFIAAATTFKAAIEGLAQMGPIDQISDEQAGKVVEGRGLLHALVQDIRSAVALSDQGTMRQLWVSTSLLGTLAMMALEDLTGSTGRVRRCSTCARLFVSRSYQASYCSQTCRGTSQKRRYRMRRETSAMQGVNDDG